MTETDHAGPAPPPGPEVRHEPSDANVRGIFIVGGALVVSAVVVYVVIWWVFVALKQRADAMSQGEFPLAAEEGRRTVGERIQGIRKPRLEGLKPEPGGDTDVPPEDLQAARDRRLRTYGPADPPEPGYVRVPIDVAMRAVLEKGRLPVQPEAEKKP